MTDKYLTVTALTKYIKRKMDVDSNLNNISLRGEISNFKLHSRGHMYFTLKDDQARLQSVMFAGNNRNLPFMPENGMNVLVKGEITVFEAYGQYQLYVQQMEPDGVGSLYLAFEQLKEKLQKKGYFDAVHKKVLPMYPQHIGVITSPTGAAIRDILTTLKRRYPIAKRTLLPVLVQGVNAAASIKEAIETANKSHAFDVLIIGRGGGSIEDLWGFNEEIVAEAIFQSKIPIISAVGHETDTTISDFVADLRAPTPTGAAELAVPSQSELIAHLQRIERNITSAVQSKLGNDLRHLERVKQSYAFRYPKQLLLQKEQQLDSTMELVSKRTIALLKRKNELLGNLQIRLLNQHPQKQFEQAKHAFNRLIKQKNYYTAQHLEKHTRQLANTIEKLTLLNPLEIMKRGFAIPYSNTDSIVYSVQDVRVEDQITVKFQDGVVNCKVIDVKEDNNG